MNDGGSAPRLSPPAARQVYAYTMHKVGKSDLDLAIAKRERDAAVKT